MRIQMKNIALIVVLLVILCSSRGVQATSEIYWWHAMPGSAGEAVAKLAEGFNAIQDDYQVIPIYKGNYRETMVAALDAYQKDLPPHIVQVLEVGTINMMTMKDLIYPVEQLFHDAQIAFDTSDYLPSVISYYQTEKGELLSFPFNSSSPVLWYNKDAFAKAGIRQIPRTWQEMETASRQLVAAGYKAGFSIGWQSWTLIENYSAWHNLPMGTLNNGFGGLGTELTFNNKHLAAILDRIYQWSGENLFEYTGRREKGLPAFINEEVAMWLSSSSYYSAIKRRAHFNFGQTMMPYSPEIIASPQNAFVGGASLWVLRGNPAADYHGVARFFKYLSNPRVQAWWHQVSGYVPITHSAYKLSVDQGYYQRHHDADTPIRQLRLNPPTENSRGLRFGNYVQIREVINEEMEEIWKGNKSAQQALDDAVRRGNLLLREFEKSNTYSSQ